MKNAIRELVTAAMWAVGGVLSALIPGRAGGVVFAACEANEAAIRGE